MKIALGTAQFGMEYGVANTSGQTSSNEAQLILIRAQKYGMDTIDTAIAYGNCESVLGDLGIENWKTITKLPAVPEECTDVAQWVHKQILQSMSRLKVAQLYGVSLHRPGQLLERIGPDLYSALLNIKSLGMTRKIGISVYSPDELAKLVDKYPIDLVQAPVNIIDCRLVESGWAGRLQNAGVEVHARSSFLQGLLLMPSKKRPSKFNGWSDVWNLWDSWLSRERLTPLQACLRFVCNLSEIDRVIVGVDTVSQLDQIMEASVGELNSLPKFNFLNDARLINPSTWDQL